MKLDFSALAQPSQKVRGQMGTAGTPGSTRVSASPLTQPCAGTCGDKAAAAVLLVADPVVAIPAGCSPASPACPQVADAEKINVGAVSPMSPLVPIETVQVATAAPFECEDLAGRPTGTNANTCGNCLHLLRRGTCGEPLAAGLLTAEEGFGIVWPAEGHGARCAAFTGKLPGAAAEQPHWLKNEVADGCHVPCRDDAETAAFMARTEHFALQGRADAGDLAERLTLRDRDGDDRRLCLECTWLGDTGRCIAAATGRLRGADRRLEPVQTILQRCEAFGLRKGLS